MHSRPIEDANIDETTDPRDGCFSLLQEIWRTIAGWPST